MVKQWGDADYDPNEYDVNLRSHMFCFVPYGHGWGSRIIAVMATGCVPVIIQDHTYQPFEDILPYEDFSIRLNNGDIPHLPRVLRSVTPQQLEVLQRGVATYWRAFLWNEYEEVKPLAFEYTMLSLRRRYMNMKSMYYGLHEPELFK